MRSRAKAGSQLLHGELRPHPAKYCCSEALAGVFWRHANMGAISMQGSLQRMDELPCPSFEPRQLDQTCFSDFSQIELPVLAILIAAILFQRHLHEFIERLACLLGRLVQLLDLGLLLNVGLGWLVRDREQRPGSSQREDEETGD